MASHSGRKCGRCIQSTSRSCYRSPFFCYSTCTCEIYKFRMNNGEKMTKFNEIFNKWDWKPIPNCPGRYVLKSGPQKLSVHDILGQKVDVLEFETPMARDNVVVFELPEGGIISYKKKDGSYFHTLCDKEGFKIKLEQLEIDIVPGFIIFQ